MKLLKKLFPTLLATLMIAAASLGVDSAPMEGFDPERIREAFGVTHLWVFGK